MQANDPFDLPVKEPYGDIRRRRLPALRHARRFGRGLVLTLAACGAALVPSASPALATSPSTSTSLPCYYSPASPATPTPA